MQVMQPTVKLESITPEIAKQMLSRNKKNRPLNERNMQIMVADMKGGTFNLTGDTIKFSVEGDLLDGQHRLHAIVKSNTTQQMMVARGLESESFKYIDIGKKRSAGDVLGIMGMKYPHRVAAVTKFIMMFKNGNYAGAMYSDAASKVTHAKISEYAEENLDSITESMRFGFDKENKIVPPVLLSAMHFIFKSINSNDADEFSWKLASGANLTKDNPIYVLRQKMIMDIRQQKKIRSLEQLALFCKAWNLYRKNQRVSTLKWDGLKDPFPKPI